MEINFKRLSDFELLAYSNMYAKELKNKNDLLESRLVILINLIKTQKKIIKNLGKSIKKLQTN